MISGALWSMGYPWHWVNNAYSHYNTPNKLSCVSTSDTATAGGCGMGCVQWGGTAGMFTATSNHPGGANFCFIDGSVHFLKSSISMQTYWSLGTRANGEVISSDSY